MTKLPTVSPLLFESKYRVIKRCGSSPAVSVPQFYEESLRTLGERRLRAAVLRNYLIYTPLPFVMLEKHQLLDITMTALEALAMLDEDERIKEAWLKLKELGDRYDAEGVRE